MMSEAHFTKCLRDIFAAHGKRMPEQAIQEAIFKRVNSFPDDFMDFALAQLEDADELPKNMGNYLLRNLWPEYLEAHPELKSRHEKRICPRCCPSLPGWRKVYRPEMTVIGLRYVPEIVRCPCGNARNPRNERIYQDYELENLGFKLDCPYVLNKENPPAFMSKVIGMIESKRPEHEAYLASLDAEEWQI